MSSPTGLRPRSQIVGTVAANTRTFSFAGDERRLSSELTQGRGLVTGVGLARRRVLTGSPFPA